MLWTRLLGKAGLAQKTAGWHVLHLHTLRKYFKTEGEISGMPTPMVETLMGHTGRGLDPSYWRPREPDVVAAYRKAVPNLTVSETE